MIPKVDVPEGASGKWRIERFEITEFEANIEKLRAAFNPQRPYRAPEPGMYTRLIFNGSIIMSDTPAEVRDHIAPVRRARGHVLITGLGLGLVANACLLKPEVESVTVIEIDPDVIKLVEPHYSRKFPHKFRLHQADAFTWKPINGERYSVVWHDIWPDISMDNLPEMTKLKRRFARRADWQGCWSESDCRAQRERIKTRTGFY